MPLCPSPISGSIGSRVRVVLGSSGDEWLVLFQEQEGDRKWQTPEWAGIPHSVAKQINNCTEKDRHVPVIDFGPTGAWYINGVKRDGTGGHSWWDGGSSADPQLKEWGNSGHGLYPAFGSDLFGRETYVIIQGRNGHACSGTVDNDLQQRIAKIHRENKHIKMVRLFAAGGYFISDDEGTEWKNLGVHCGNELKKRNTVVEDLAVAADETWVLIKPDSYVCSTGISEKLQQHLGQFYSRQRRRVQARQAEIRQFQQRRAERERQEREEQRHAEREREEREERDRAERERREREEREREERERREEEERREAERVQRERREREERAARADGLLRNVERRLLEEHQSIREMEAYLQKRKRSLRSSLEEMPSESRVRLEEQGLTAGSPSPSDSATTSLHSKTCVVCHDARISRIIAPCGHYCMCEECTATLLRMPERNCPVCRGHIDAAIKVFENTGGG